MEALKCQKCIKNEEFHDNTYNSDGHNSKVEQVTVRNLIFNCSP